MASSPSDSRFIELDILRSANGTKGIISQRVSSGAITFSIVKEFQRDGSPDWTSFFGESEFKDVEDMLSLLKKRIAELRKDPNVAPMRVAGARR